jgi:hypothetical protein
MDIAKPNAHGVLPEGLREVVASRGRAYSTISFALGEDNKYRYSDELHYSRGGVITPIRSQMELLSHRLRTNPSYANAVRDELANMRRQVEAQLAQPSLF